MANDAESDMRPTSVLSIGELAIVLGTAAGAGPVSFCGSTGDWVRRLGEDPGGHTQTLNQGIPVLLLCLVCADLSVLSCQEHLSLHEPRTGAGAPPYREARDVGLREFR